jgi:hypothetical protein
VPTWEPAIAILTIRKHQRFAVRHDVGIVRDGQHPRSCLLVEVSLEGARLAVPGSEALAIDQRVMLEIDGFGSLAAHVRWTRDGVVGLKFAAALHHAELDELIHICRAAPALERRHA